MTALRDLVRGADGSVTVLLSCRPPDAQDPVNWLPAPRGRFYVMLRLYLPGAAALDGSWAPPAIERTCATPG